MGLWFGSCGVDCDERLALKRTVYVIGWLGAVFGGQWMVEMELERVGGRRLR